MDAALPFMAAIQTFMDLPFMDEMLSFLDVAPVFTAAMLSFMNAALACRYCSAVV